MKRFVVWLPIVLIATGTLAAQTDSGARSLAISQLPPLPRDTRIEDQLAGGQIHEYQFFIQAGQYAKVSIEQNSINVAVAVLAPDGAELYAADNSSIGESENAEVIAGASGEYRVRVTATEAHAPVGYYAIVLHDVNVATDRHKIRAAAARAFSIGMAAYRRGARDAMLQATDQLHAARALWQKSGDVVDEARTLCAIAAAYIALGDREKALDAATKSLSIAQASGDSRVLAQALDATGEVHNYFGDKKKAIEYYEQALPRMRASGYRAGEAKTLSNLGVAYSGTGEKHKALVLFEKSVQILRELQDRRMVAEVAGNIGVTYDKLGEYERALEKHLEELALVQELGDRESEAVTQNNIGSVYSGLGTYQKALDAYNAALKINRALENRWNVAINLNNIAWVYANLGDRTRALRFYEESLEIVRAINDHRRVAITLNNIANIHAELGHYSRAIELHKEALPLRRAAADRDGEANSLNNLGEAYGKLGDAAKAREYFERALEIHRASGNRYMLARTLRNLGALFGRGADPDNALAYINEALQISKDIHDQKGEAAALAEVARVESDRGNLAIARERTEEALAALEAVRLSVASPTFRASLLASARDLQELNIDILMRMHATSPGAGFDAAALLASERGRARSLIELLGESRAEIRRGVDAALLERERYLERVISAKADQQSRFLSGKHTHEESDAAAKELNALTTELEQTQSRIRETSPRYAALTQPVPLSVKDIQSRVLDEHTVLLEYELGTRKSFLWIVAPSSVHSFDLRPRAEIEAAAQTVYQLLTARNQKPPRELPEMRAARVSRADQAYAAAAAKLSDMLLGPAGSLIENKRLLIVGGGVLQYLPFGALPAPGTQVPLLVHHEIVAAPSASVVALLRQESVGREAAEKELLVLADPVFSADDSRVKKHPVASAAIKPVVFGDHVRSGAEGEQGFVRLRFSRNEADEIAKLTPAAATVKALDFDASRDTVLGPDVGKYRLVHFATHSLLNNDNPELSGIVLSLVGRDGRPQNGFLRLYDIYNLRLAADLVVLSACKTALGGEINGEGLIGLTRGFLYAGAPRVVASLWEIDDRTSAQLMIGFYQAMLVRGERPAAALRAAQLAMWRTKGWEAPFYWAAFTLQGEWR